MIITLADAYQKDFDQGAYKVCNSPFFKECFDYWIKQNLRVDLKTSVVRSNRGWMSCFPGYDWQERYTTHPQDIFFDFFLGIIGNSCSRKERGLNF